MTAALVMYAVGAFLGVLVLPIVFVEFEFGEQVEHVLEGLDDAKRAHIGALCGLLWPLFAIAAAVEAIGSWIARRP